MMINKIILGIKSCAKNRARKKSIEDTWLKKIDTNIFFPVFLVGRKGQPDCLEKNILYLDCDDDYVNLYTKTVAYFKWAFYNSDSSHIWICDDDSYINCNIFNKYSKYLEYDYSGLFLYGMEKINDTSGYTSGCGYCLSRKATKILIENVDEMVSLKMISLRKSNDILWEDMLVGDTLNKHMQNLKKLHIPEIYPWSRCRKYDNLLIGHYVHHSEPNENSKNKLNFYDSMKKMHSFYYK